MTALLGAKAALIAFSYMQMPPMVGPKGFGITRSISPGACVTTSMFTDPGHLKASDPGKIEGNTVFTYLDAFATPEVLFAKITDEEREDWQARFSACLKEARQAGQLAPGADTDQLAACFWIGWEGAVLRAKLEQTDRPLQVFAGFFFARLWNVYEVGVYVPEQNFTLMGMAGLITGVMHAPLTGIFLIAELTGGYQLFMPLMIVCISSLLTISIFESHSIYALRLAREGKLLTHHIDRAALTLMSMQSLVEKDYHPIKEDLPMEKLVSEISRSNNNFLPVLDEAGVLLGVIDITKIRHIIFRTELYKHFKVKQLMLQPSAVISENERMDEVMQKFDKTDAAQLPVVDINGVLKGYISRTKVYEVYRHIVADISAE